MVTGVANSLAENGHGFRGYGLLTLLISLALFLTVFWLPWAETDVGARSIFLFFGILPIINAPTDYASYAVTIWLVRQSLKTPRWAFVMGLLDVAVAIILYTVLGAILVLVVAGANALAGVPIFRLTRCSRGCGQTPLPMFGSMQCCFPRWCPRWRILWSRCSA